MGKLRDSLKKANIPADIAEEIESEMFKNFVALDGFPPLKFEREIVMPIQYEQMHASERMETLNFKFDAFRGEAEARFFSLEGKIESLRTETETRFISLDGKMETKFLALDAKIDSLQKVWESKFQILETKVDSLRKEIEIKFENQKWMMGMILTLNLVMMAMIGKMFVQ